MTVDMIIKNGTVITDIETFRGTIAIDDGLIVAITNEASSPKGEVTIDASGKLILPGVIDPHVHFRDPGLTTKEDFATGTQAAAAGGVTMVMDMPNTLPLVDRESVFMNKIKEVSPKAIVDFGLAVALGPDNLKEIPLLANAGAVFFKTLMGGYHPNDRPDVDGMINLHDGDLLAGFHEVAKTGRVMTVHAESEDLREYYTNKTKSSGHNNFASYPEGRPPITEIEAVTRAILLAERAGCRLHIAHASTIESIDLAQTARLKGQAVTTEVTPHHMLLSIENIPSLGPYGIMNPPLRNNEERKRVWEAVMTGKVDFVGSDHAPHTQEEKSGGRNDVWRTPAGVIGVETLLPLLMTEALNGAISLQSLVRITSKSVARTYGLFPRKGMITVGADADIVIVDPKKGGTIREEDLHSKHKKSPFLGRKVIGMPIATLVRGRTVVRNSEIVGKPGWGRLVKPNSQATGGLTGA